MRIRGYKMNATERGLVHVVQTNIREKRKNATGHTIILCTHKHSFTVFL